MQTNTIKMRCDNHVWILECSDCLAKQSCTNIGVSHSDKHFSASRHFSFVTVQLKRTKTCKEVNQHNILQ